jgi:multifunctional methyltransferase subunit TRM112
MKLLTTNFLTCAVKSCKSSPLSFPLHFKDAVLERTEIAYNPLFMTNILPRLNWDALRTTATELGLAAALPTANPSEQAGWLPKDSRDKSDGREAEDDEEEGGMEVESTAVAGEAETAAAEASSGPISEVAKEEVLKKLHGLLLETAVSEGKLVCANCGFEYPIKDGVGNFLLPAHLV